ncbi:unnamed protein product [Adineta ricciae]|uniref:Uncharacterized protein n=1 Tax=Adineta ricciae TaxID=249248 RepID=A0A815QR59_ADIRI|nr:unnamed protein product [Adineta ricciae]
MKLFDRTSVRSGKRFGGLSSSMFFVRNSPHPQRVRHMEGLNGAWICNVNDDLDRDKRSKRNKANDYNKNNLPINETGRRTERLVPPTTFWNTHGLIHDTDKWRQELANLAAASGIGSENENKKHSNKSALTADPKNASRSGAHYSTKTGRFNESASKSRGRTSTKHGAGQTGETLFNVPEDEREAWMLQVLCQLLDTCNLEDVQSWLVSASPAEKEQARSMINAALRGLKESERTSTSSDIQDSVVDFDSLSNFVERQKNEEKYASQKYVNDALNRSAPVLPSVDEQQQEQQPDFGLNDTWEIGGVTRSYIYPGDKTNQSNIENLYPSDNEEQVDTIRLSDDRHRARSTSLTKKSQNYDSPRERPLTSYRENPNVESIQFNDNVNNPTISYLDEIHNEDGKSRKIRELQTKLSRQEEEAKKKFDELQTKQSRLENAIRLLAKQTASRKANQQNTSGQNEGNDRLLFHENSKSFHKYSDAPVFNVIIQSPQPKGHRHKSSKSRATPFIHADTTNKKSRDDKPGAKLGDYNVEDVKVQISLSRLDNQQPKVYGGVWKHDAQTLQRLQGC